MNNQVAPSKTASTMATTITIVIVLRLFSDSLSNMRLLVVSGHCNLRQPPNENGSRSHLLSAAALAPAPARRNHLAMAAPRARRTRSAIARRAGGGSGRRPRRPKRAAIGQPPRPAALARAPARHTRLAAAALRARRPRLRHRPRRARLRQRDVRQATAAGWLSFSRLPPHSLSPLTLQQPAAYTLTGTAPSSANSTGTSYARN